MKRNLSDYLVAFFAITCTLALLGAMAVGLGTFKAGKSGRAIDIDFSDVSGIKLHSQLRYAGTRAGHVTAIRPLTSGERRQSMGGPSAAVRVTVAVDDDVPPIPSDTVASISSDTMLGEKYIAFSAGSADATPLASGAQLAGHAGFSLENLTGVISPLLENTNQTVADLRTQLSDLMPRIRSLVVAVNTTAGTGTTLLTSAEQLIKNNEGNLHQRIEELGTVLDKLGVVLEQSRQAVNSTNTLVTESRAGINQRIVELGTVLQNMKVITTHTKAITESLGEQPSRIVWGTKKSKLTPEAEILHTDKPLPAKKP